MIRTPTVFVVGAGASCELNFPSGPKLLEALAATLDIRFGGSELKSGDLHLVKEFDELARAGSGQHLNAYLASCWRIRDAAKLGLSIDNVINQLDADPLVPICGKIGIARQLLLAENASLIRFDPYNPSDFPLAEMRSTWLGRFAQLVCQDMRASDLQHIFDNISIVSFNYDRSIRRFLPYALMSQFGIDERSAEALANKLRIYHPYGSLGLLPWQTGYSGGIGYGDADAATLNTVASNLRTFTEQIEDSDELMGMTSALSNAERIVFLGFGYHRQNMELLTRGMSPNAKRVYGTALGLSASDIEVVKSQLSSLFLEQYRPHHDARLLGATCADFLQEHFSTFVS